jgi:hypothetical protein
MHLKSAMMMQAIRRQWFRVASTYKEMLYKKE